jgi:hypothetical protein
VHPFSLALAQQTREQRALPAGREWLIGCHGALMNTEQSSILLLSNELHSIVFASFYVTLIVNKINYFFQ